MTRKARDLEWREKSEMTALVNAIQVSHFPSKSLHTTQAKQLSLSTNFVKARSNSTD